MGGEGGEPVVSEVPREVEGGGEVGLEDVGEGGEGELVGWVAGLDAGGVDEDVDCVVWDGGGGGVGGGEGGESGCGGVRVVVGVRGKVHGGGEGEEEVRD